MWKRNSIYLISSWYRYTFHSKILPIQKIISHYWTIVHFNLTDMYKYDRTGVIYICKKQAYARVDVRIHYAVTERCRRPNRNIESEAFGAPGLLGIVCLVFRPAHRRIFIVTHRYQYTGDDPVELRVATAYQQHEKTSYRAHVHCTGGQVYIKRRG